MLSRWSRPGIRRISAIGGTRRATCVKTRQNAASLRAEAKAPDTSMYADDDSEYFGRSPAYGMRLPNLSKQDQAYLDQAKSEKDFMKRMTQIAHRLDQERKSEGVRSKRQSSEEYIEGLKKLSMEKEELHRAMADDDNVVEESPSVIPTPPSPPPYSPSSSSTTPPEPVEDTTNDDAGNMEDIEARIAALNKQLMDAVGDDTDFDKDGKMNSDEVIEEYSEDQLSDGARQIEALQKQIHDQLGGEPPKMSAPLKAEAPAAQTQTDNDNNTSEDEPSPAGNANVVDRQIEYLEHYVSRLKREVIEEGDEEKLVPGEGPAASEVQDEATLEAQKEARSLMEKLNDKMTNIGGGQEADGGIGAEIGGWENTPGEMSAEEKRAAFEALRQQAIQGKQMSDEFSDPFNVTLPEKKDSAGGGGDEVGNIDLDFDGDGDVPMGDASEYDSFGPVAGGKKILVEEVEMEMKSYLGEAKRLLRNHESRMNLLLTRLSASLSDDKQQ